MSRCLVVSLLVATAVTAADWPAYRHDNARSGITAEQLATPLAPCWVYRPTHGPRPAWGDPNPRRVGGWYGLVEKRRVHFDDVFQVVVAGGSLYFGSSADGAVTALDVATGKPRWRTATDGPVRLAPAVVGDRVYVGSDDGFAYCLQARDGAEVWRFRGAPGDRKLLGSGKMISLWPLRTGVLVDGGRAYFGAGIFPAEGVYLYAVDAADGTLQWCNDTCGAQPQSRISPQGYLLASESRLFAPMGRVSPAAFDRKDGRLLHETYFTHRVGGTHAMLQGDQVFTGTEEIVAYNQKSRARSAWFEGRRLLVTADTAYLLNERELLAIDRAKHAKASLRRQVLVDQRIRAARPLAVAKRNERRLAGPVQQGQRLLAQLDKQIAALGRQDAAKLAKLRSQRAQAARKLAADTKALEGAKRATAKPQSTMDRLNAQLREADATIASSVRWRAPTTCADELILAGNTLFAGGAGQVVAIHVGTGKQLWTTKVDGAAKGLAVAGGRLFVSTDTGAIYCFGPAGSKDLGVVKQQANPAPFPRDDTTAVVEAAADHIVGTTGIKRGYCLVLGAGSGRLIYELAKRTQLQFVGVCLHDQRVEATKAALDAAGLYGSRVVLHKTEPSRVPFADFFANLVVSEGPLLHNRMPFDVHEAIRMTRPLGGTICFGQPSGRGSATPLEQATLRTWSAGIEGADLATTKAGTWLTWRRGKLPGAGSWTHQYAEPGNTTCSDDQLVKCPLGVLWYGKPGPGDMVERHRRSAAPLSANGRLFIEGLNCLKAYDAYNGLKLWERKIPGAIRTSISHEASNLVANDDSLFAAVGDKCLRLDAATGKTVQTYAMPPAADGRRCNWGYVACVGDLLYGTRSPSARVANCVFALDIATGALRWKHEGASIPQGAIAIGDGRVFLAKSNVSEAQRREALQELADKLKTLKGAERAAAERRLKSAVVQLIVALDAKTGRPVWQRPLELTDCNVGAYWCSLGAVYSRDVLLLFGVFLDGHHWRQFFAGQFDQRRIMALDGTDGRRLWTKQIGYRVRPIVVGDTLHAEPWAFDLRTGRQRTRAHPVTGREEVWQFARPGHHCGAPAACPNVMLFRSYCLAWYDLAGDYGTQHFGAQRPGCWINFIPANGLLLVPEASSGCQCPFPTMCTIVFKPRAEGRQWAYFSTPGAMTPVKRLALNLGAPGDRKDKAGTLWLGYPRPGGSLVLRFNVALSYLDGWSRFRHDPARLQVAGTETPWVFRSGFRGLKQCVIPLVGAGDGAARYTVRLAFADLEQAKPGVRVFDIKLQGKVVASGFDVAKEAGGRSRAVVKEFKGIDVHDKLTIELVPKAAKPTPEQMPILQGIDVEREKVLSLGFAVPSFVLNDGEPQQSGEVRIGNHKAAEFVGTLRIEAPEGFAVTPPATPVKLATGQRLTVPVKAAVAGKAVRGTRAAVVRLVRADGTVECEAKAAIEYLGAIGRTTVKASEDACVAKRAPDSPRGNATRVYVDGGAAKMGDESHAVLYLKFPLKVPGKVVSATLRLHNAGNPTSDSGRVCLVAGPWSEKILTYNGRPKAGHELARIGPVTSKQVVEVSLKASLLRAGELSLVIEPVNCDGVDYLSREAGKPAELVVEYQQ